MILRHRLRKALHPRPGTPGRGNGPMARASDIILVMMAGLLVIAAAFKILQG
ncbi:hypothetical protein ACCT14_10020 [Rhizobium brockwellii]|jgi:hypothetical protein|uniref:hypothetical protein n=1 Tax=Rhizobium TaxID=379 RepID=UPI000AA0E453|nr:MULTISPECIES: hypothetical protein [Rhizobium]MDV4153802.1 hypothetical protein [Rhizobium brockwellii]NZD50287.1 hypothetical protein [Rhizobium leguminosarum]QIO55212.1 hypothetical protein HA461_28870 [Rhizobium leguminosarum bv. trifolii]QJX09089.1 hypothetical protein RLCC275e_29325 [Rhizobium brockwellii]QND17880.1 hypothetical protein HB775_29670 [Rhizobium leguminosarum bv. trifolii]